MTKEQKIEAIRQKCVEANPELANAKYENICVCCEYKTGHFYTRPIRLADVLLTTHKNDVKRADVLIETFNIGKPERDQHLLDIVYRWNLRADDLTAQSEETIDFIYDLIK